MYCKPTLNRDSSEFTKYFRRDRRRDAGASVKPYAGSFNFQKRHAFEGPHLSRARKKRRDLGHLLGARRSWYPDSFCSIFSRARRDNLKMRRAKPHTPRGIDNAREQIWIQDTVDLQTGPR